MKSYHLKNRTGRRSAFTLVEMLMVILIIGILVGLVGSAALGAYRTAQEFTITQEVMQLEAQIEQFKTKYGFYPPTIGNHADFEINNVATMRRYLNRISPNNAEGNGTATGTGLRNWWVNVGQRLDDRSSLVFWLSGLCKSKQYPLSGSAAVASDTTNTLALAPYNGAFTFLEAPSTDFERDVMFEFNGAQLEVVTSGAARVAIYNQPNGKDNGSSAFRYLDNKSYLYGTTAAAIGASAPSPNGGAYYNGFYPVGHPKAGQKVFYNEDKFQIVSPGLDGLVWQTVNSATGATRADADFTTNVQNVDEGQLDNITNFTQGRLDIEADQ